jgi:hypothetical protein
MHLINVQMLLFTVKQKCSKQLLGSILWSVISGSSLGGWVAMGGVCRASVHSFHRLPILDRTTDHKCNNNCNRPIEIWVGFKCNGLIVFSQRGGASKVYNTCVIYSLEYSGILYMFMCPYSCQYGGPADFLSIQFMQNTPFNGEGGDWLLTHS